MTSLRTDTAGPAPSRFARWASVAAIAAGVLAAAFASWRVAAGHPGWAAVGGWGVGVALVLLAFAPEWSPVVRRLRPSRRWLVVVLIGLAPVAVRLALASPARIHGDELITAYFSLTEDLSAQRFFAEVPRVRVEWVSQFPTPFFLVQRWLLAAVGDDVSGVRLSVQPYVFLVGVLLFLLAREIADRETAWIAATISTFLAISLYLETLGLHFVSSTAVFLAFFLVGVRAIRSGRCADAAATGVLCGACYLFYTSSYVALPLMVAVGGWQVLRSRGRGWARMLLLPVTACAVTVAPFVAHALTHYNYFNSRLVQVSLLSGQWSDVPERVARGESLPSILATNAGKAVLALGEGGIGGHGGYWFGYQGLFDPLSLLLLIAGTVMALRQARRRPALMAAVAVAAATFVSGIVLTIPPPAFHRWSLAWPFLALLMALPIRALLGLGRLTRFARVGTVAAVLLLFASINLGRFTRATFDDSVPLEIRLGEMINCRFPDKKLYVASFPGQAYEKLAYFANVRRRNRAVTTYHTDLLETFRTDEDYLYVIAIPDDFGARFHSLDPSARLVRVAPQYALLFK
jgi:hypothetical protein